jgi:hypothetical protein
MGSLFVPHHYNRAVATVDASIGVPFFRVLMEKEARYFAAPLNSTAKQPKLHHRHLGIYRNAKEKKSKPSSNH